MKLSHLNVAGLSSGDPAVTPTHATVYDMQPAATWGVQGTWFGAGKSRTLETTINFGAVGSHTLWAWADPYRMVAETNDNNNGRQSVQNITVLSEGTGGQGQSIPLPVPTPTNEP